MEYFEKIEDLRYDPYHEVLDEIVGKLDFKFLHGGNIEAILDKHGIVIKAYWVCKSGEIKTFVELNI